MTINPFIPDLSFFDTYIIPLMSACLALYGTLLARKEKLNGSERMLQGLKDQFMVNDMLLKVLEHSVALAEDGFKKSLLGQIELIRIVLQHSHYS
ncbi:hypothetical protein IX51_03775 [uncultured archaeon]|nr:hypothetical protein IX51_03775 [uncultured archaeon]